MDAIQTLWDISREELSSGFSQYKGGGSTEWTEIRTAAAKATCRRFAEISGRDVFVGEQLRVKMKDSSYRKFDVYAQDKSSTMSRLFITLETELAPWGYKGTKKDWRRAFERLCVRWAEHRVLWGTYDRTGDSFEQSLPGYLKSLKHHFDSRDQFDGRGRCDANGLGGFLLAFGPVSAVNQKKEWWRAYSLEPDYTLRPLTSSILFIPYQVIPNLSN
jgi:hypothetical protein